MNYSQLQTAVINHLHRSDLTSLVTSFISTAEAFLFRELNIKELQLTTALTTTGGYATLPADFGSVSRLTCTQGSREYSLDYLTSPNAAVEVSAYPQYYTLEDGQIRIFGAADGAGFTLYYIPRIDALSVQNDTNWLLDYAQDLYLYASALEGARYIRDEAEMAKLQALVLPLLDGVKRYAERRGQPATGSLQIKPRR